MPRLIDRNKQIPNGIRFYQPQTGWKSRQWQSFDTVVQALIAHRRANMALVQKHGLTLDPKLVADEVDLYNAMFCQRMGWTQYITDDGGSPKTIPPNRILGPLGSVVAGGSTIIEWLSSGAEAIPKEQAEARAKICADCPQNGKGDWTQYFTVPVSEKIRTALNQRREWKLETSVDDKLKVCEACDCPLPLKVHMPIQRIFPKMSEQNRAKLDPRCWIPKEASAK